MKYYPKKPLVLYLILSVLGGLLFGFIVIAVWSFAAEADPNDLVIWSILFLSVATVFALLLFFNNYKDYIELSGTVFNFTFDKRRKQPAINIDIHDVEVFEVVSFSYDWPKTKYFVIYDKGHDAVQFNTNDIPEKAVMQFCSENNLVPRHVRLQNWKTDNLVFGKKRLTFDYGDKWWKSGPVNIKYTDIASIDLALLHPVSATENYLVLHTKKGKQYTFAEFSSEGIERDIMNSYAKEYGFSIVEKRMFNAD